MSETLNVQRRELRGKREMRRLRRAGTVPAVLYGHGEDNICLVAQSEELATIIRHGARVVDLQGAVAEKAFIRDLQWDVYGTEILHFDLARVSADEKVKIELTVELRGEAPGTKDGGVVTQFVHHIMVECPVISIPEKISISIKGLALGSSILAKDVVLPPGLVLVSDEDAVVVQCEIPKTEEEQLAGAGGSLEPEVIGRKADDDEDD